MQSDYDNSLQSYFTDVEHPRDMFKNFVSAEKLSKRLIVFHGVGGVGKSSLLRMFRLHCKSENIPVALVSGDDAKSVLDVVTRWTEDLKEDGIKFPAFNKTLESYRAIQAKVEDQVKKSQNKVADIASKAASKTAETAGGALLGAAIGSVIPGVGTAIGGALGGVVSGMGAEAITDWLRGFLSKPDIDLLLDPAKKLSTDFLEDIAKTADKKRIVLLLDTFEQMSALEDWVGEVAQKIYPNVLMVIAGRILPNWNRVWSSWMMNAQIEELKPMAEDVMRELIHRYHATMRGGEPEPAQVEAIIRFARGLPMVVTSAVQLWVKYGVEDFQSVKAEIVANLVDRLMEGVSSALLPALEAAAVVRWFDQPILRAVMKQEDVRDVYNELRRFPFVRTRVEGLALHDSVREIMDENLRVQDSERHAELHERAAVYFEKRLEKVTGEEVERLGLERLYHRVRTDEETGIKLFQENAEDLTRYRRVNQLRVLLNDVNTYSLEHENNRLWRKYYNARLTHLETRVSDAEKIYQAIADDMNAELKLRAYALCDWGGVCRQYQRLGQPGGTEQAIHVLKRTLETAPQIDSKLALVFLYFSWVYNFRGEWERGIEYMEQLLQFFTEIDDKYGIVYALTSLKPVYGMMGNWRKAFDMISQGQEVLKLIPENRFMRIRLGYYPWVRLWSGRYSQTEQEIFEGLSVLQQSGDEVSRAGLLHHLGLALGMQEKYTDAFGYFRDSIQISEKMVPEDKHNKAIALGDWGMILIRQGNLEEGQKYLMRSLSMRQEIPDNQGIPGVLNFLGMLYEIRQEWVKSETFYNQSLNYRWVGLRYWECTALVGLIRLKHMEADIATIPSLLVEAEQLAQQYEYNDHLASLRLIQGHLAWENGSKDEVLACYQKAMIYALRYNRFLLDELISGRSQGTPLRPIIPYCLENRDSGKKILLVLLDWWKTGVNDIGTLRSDTISPMSEGIPLLEAEKIAREREPGDGSMQRTVVDQFEVAINR